MKNKAMEYMSVQDASNKWKMTQQKIIELCENGKVDGAAKLSGKWIIPSDMQKQILPTSTTLSKPVTPRTKIQEVVLGHIEKGDNFHVSEVVIGKTTYTVSSVFQKQGRTLEECLTSLALSEIEQETKTHLSVAEHNELMKKVRKDSNAAKATFDDYIEHYRKEFVGYGFSNSEIEILLERKALDFEEFKL